jgi:hypothetical protein
MRLNRITHFLIFVVAFLNTPIIRAESYYEFERGVSARLSSSSAVLQVELRVISDEARVLNRLNANEEKFLNKISEIIRDTSERDLAQSNSINRFSSRIEIAFEDVLRFPLGLEPHQKTYRVDITKLYLDKVDLLKRLNYLNRHLEVTEAKIKGISPRLREADLKNSITTFSTFSNNGSGDKLMICGSKKFRPCDFSIAGQNIFGAELDFRNGILRDAVFVLEDTYGDSMPKKIETYERIRDAFIEKFGFPFNAIRGPDGLFSGFYERGEVGESRNKWFFGNQEIVISLDVNYSSMHQYGNHISIRIADIQFFKQKNEAEDKTKRERFESEKKRDSQKRKNDF